MKADMNNMSEEFTRLNPTLLNSTEDEIILNLASIRIESDSAEDEDNQRHKSNKDQHHQNHSQQDEKDQQPVFEQEVEDNEDVSTDSDEKTDEDADNHDEDDLLERGPMPGHATRPKKRSQPYVPPATDAIDIPGTSSIGANSSRVVARDLMMGGTMAINETVPEANSYSPDASSTTNGNNTQSRSCRLYAGGGCIQNAPAPVTVMTTAWDHIAIPTWPVVDSLSVSPVKQHTSVVDVETNRDIIDIEGLLNSRRTNKPSPKTTWETARSNPSPFSPSGSSDCSSEPLTPSPPTTGDELQFPADVAEMILERQSDDDASQSPRYNPTSEVSLAEELALMFGAPPLAENSKLVRVLDVNDRTEACSQVSALPENLLLLQDEQGDTQLHIAVANRELKYVHAIVERMYCLTLTLDTRNEKGQTALSMAISLNYPEVVEFLLIYGAQIDMVDMLDQYGGNVLHFLASNGDRYLDVMKELCNFGVTFAINKIDDYGQTPLHRAVHWHSNCVKSIPIIELLMNNGAQIIPDPNNAVTPLHLAARKCSPELMEVLCRLAPNITAVINRRDSCGKTALDIVYSLTNVNQRDKDNTFQILIRYGAHPPLEEVLELLSSG